MRKYPGDHRSKLNSNPSLTDITVAACRRIHAFLPDCHRASWNLLVHSAIQQARAVPTEKHSWRRCDLRRYSGRQKAELQLRGICGSVDFPEGPGDLGLILAAAQWLHSGKGSTIGMGQLLMEPLRSSLSPRGNQPAKQGHTVRPTATGPYQDQCDI